MSSKVGTLYDVRSTIIEADKVRACILSYVNHRTAKHYV